MTLKTAEIEQTAKDLMQLESEFRRFADEHDDLQGIPVFFLTREIGDLLTYATNPHATPLHVDWLESRKDKIRAAFDAALCAVGNHGTLSNKLNTAQSLSLQLARLVAEAGNSPVERADNSETTVTDGADTRKKLSVLNSARDALTKSLLTARLDGESQGKTVSEIHAEFKRTYRGKLGKNESDRKARFDQIARNVREGLKKINGTT